MSAPPSESFPRRRVFTIHGDGSSDRVLLPMVRWALRRVDPGTIWDGRWADLSRFRRPPRGLQEKLKRTIELYPCEALFVHRDQEAGLREQRLAEINRAATPLSLPFVALVPVRMTEAWLLFDEDAIRKASGNPNGRVELSLPHISTIEAHPDPKEVLFDRIRCASGLSGRRLEKLRPESLRHQVADLIDDFAPLLMLPAFRAFVDDAEAMTASLRSQPFE